MLGENRHLLEREKTTFFEQGVLALVFKRPAEAARYFLLSEEKKNSAVLFNLALCFFRAGNYQESYLYLQKSLSELPRNLMTRLSKENLLSLEQYEEENEGYQNPMSYFTPMQFPDLAREQILRLMVDVLFYLEQKEEMMKTISSLKNKNYKNVKEKMERS